MMGTRLPRKTRHWFPDGSPNLQGQIHVPPTERDVRAPAWPGIIRSCILLSIIADSADVQFAQIFAAESIVVTGFVAVSAQRDPTQPSPPKS